MSFSWASFSDRGPRAQNEDAVAVWEISENWLAAAVADGLGGHYGGRQASSIALEVFGAAVHEGRDLALAEIALSIHAAIREEQQRTPALRSMATTLSAVVLADGQARLVHCGDSRIALARAGGVVRLTEDHTEARRFLQEGLISPEEYRVYPRKNVLDSALGVHGDPRIDIRSIPLRSGDRIFLTTDGVHEKVAIQELMNLCQTHANPEEFCSAVRDIVNVRQPTDNFSLVAIYVN